MKRPFSPACLARASGICFVHFFFLLLNRTSAVNLLFSTRNRRKKKQKHARADGTPCTP
jgi:hypothetical protein